MNMAQENKLSNAKANAKTNAKTGIILALTAAFFFLTVVIKHYWLSH